jgi:hypothetical protein
MSNQPKRITKVFVAFLLSSESRRGGWRAFLKSCIRRIGGSVIHVEPVFVFDDGSAISAVVELGYPVEFWPRTGEQHYHTRFWECHPLALTEAERVRMYEFCAAQDRKPYAALYAPVSHPPLCTASTDEVCTATFCLRGAACVRAAVAPTTTTTPAGSALIWCWLRCSTQSLKMAPMPCIVPPTPLPSNCARLCTKSVSFL